MPLFLSICIAGVILRALSPQILTGGGRLGIFWSWAVAPPMSRVWSNFTFVVAVTWTRLLFLLNVLMNLKSQRTGAACSVICLPKQMTGHFLLGVEHRGGGKTDVSTSGFILDNVNAVVAGAGVQKTSLHMCRVRAGSLNFLLCRPL